MNKSWSKCAIAPCRDRSGISGDRDLPEHLLHRGVGLGYLLPGQLLQKPTSLVYLWQHVEHQWELQHLHALDFSLKVPHKSSPCLLRVVSRWRQHLGQPSSVPTKQQLGLSKQHHPRKFHWNTNVHVSGSLCEPMLQNVLSVLASTLQLRGTPVLSCLHT